MLFAIKAKPKPHLLTSCSVARKRSGADRLFSRRDFELCPSDSFRVAVDAAVVALVVGAFMAC